MTSETPCPPGCREWPTYPSNGIGWANSDGVSVTHVPNCPNAKPAEPPACKCGHGKPPHEMDDSCGECTASKCACDRYDPKQEPQSEPPISDGVGVGIANLFMGHEAETAGKVLARAYLSLKAERDALRATLLERCQTIDRLVKERDYERDQNQVLCQRAEAFDAHMTRENAALKVRVDDLENLVLDIDDGQEAATVYARAIRARKQQEATNGR